MTVEDAARLALALPEVNEGTRFGHRTWFVAGQGFAWERPLSKADIQAVLAFMRAVSDPAYQTKGVVYAQK